MTSSDFSYLFSCFTVCYTVLSGIYKLLGYTKPLFYQMAWNKKINVPISSLSSEQIYALLGNVDSDDEEDIDNLMNDSDFKFVDRTAIKNFKSENS